MHNHAPVNYPCPFCLLARSEFSHPALLTRPEDILLRTPTVIAIVSSHGWPANPGHALILPLAHHENLYDLPPELGADIFALTQQVALAMKLAYACPGTSTRQHNEPEGNQDVWHFHQHLFPRYRDDRLYERTPEFTFIPPLTRARYAAQLRAELR